MNPIALTLANKLSERTLSVPVLLQLILLKYEILQRQNNVSRAVKQTVKLGCKVLMIRLVPGAPGGLCIN